MVLEAIFVVALIFMAVIFIVILQVFWIWMIIDCANRNFKKSDEKIVWLLIVVLAQIIGALIYYFVVRQKKKE